MTEIISHPTPKTSPVLITGMDEDVTMHHFGKYNQDSYFYLAPVTWDGYSTLHDIATRYHNTEPTMEKKAKAFFHIPNPTAHPSLILIPIAALFAPGSILLATLPEDAGSMGMVLILLPTVVACMGSVSAIE